jgi:Rhodanese-like domain
MLKTKILLAIVTLILATPACNTLLPGTQPPGTATVAVDPTSTPFVIIEPTFPPTESTLPRDEAGVPRVSLKEAFAAWTNGAALFVDVRGPGAYDIKHIAGAINIPLGAIETDPTHLNLDKAQWIITYCT